MTIVKKRLSELREPEKNLRRHTETQIKEYVRSLKMFQQIKPIVIDETGEIIAGNGLFQALKSMGAKTCDCYVMAGLTPNQKKKLMLADNRIYELGITDTAIFDDIIKDLAGDFDVPGWDADLLETLNASVADANRIVSAYGQYPEAETLAVNSRVRKDHSDYAQQDERPVAVETSVEPETCPEGADRGQRDAAASPPPSDTTAEARFIICPKCGERICL